MIGVPLIFGRLTAADYEDAVAGDPRVDALRARWSCARTRRSPRTTTRPVEALHRQRGAGVLQGRHGDRARAGRFPGRPPRRRAEGIPLLVEKFEASVAGHFAPPQAIKIKAMFADRAQLEATPVHEFVSMLIKA
jgi:2-methylcitrate dehydratase